MYLVHTAGLEAEFPLQNLFWIPAVPIFQADFPPNGVFTLRGSYGKSKRPGLDQGTVLSLVPGFFIEQFSHKSSLVRCSCFRLRGLGQNLGNGFLSSEGLVLPACRACFLSYVHFVWQAWGIRDILGSKTSLCMTGAGHRTLFHSRGRRGTVLTLLKRWQEWARMRGAFGGHFAWQVGYLVNLDDVWKGSKVSLCEAVVIFDFGHDDDSVWQVQHFGCLGLIFCGRRRTLYTSTKSGWDLAKNIVFDIFNVPFWWCAQCFVKILHVLAQPSSDFVRVGSLSLWCWFQPSSRDSGQEILRLPWKVLLWRCKSFMVQSWRSVMKIFTKALWWSWILSEVLPWSCKVLVRRSCADPGKILSKRSLHEDLADAMY